MRAVDLFAGPGGWDVAARELGIETTGIEYDHAACETRRAAGLDTIEADVRQCSPEVFWTNRNADDGLIASPPCQTFSTAGKGAGRKALDKVLLGVDQMAAGELAPDFDDERTALVLEPLRWVLEAHGAGSPYRWLAFEQVPTVLPVWQRMADVFRRLGYSTFTGVLNAEQYGVPQTRRRAVLIASLDRSADQLVPKVTHSRYYTRDPRRLDEGVLPWVSMAEALGWNGEAVLRSNYGTGGDSSNRGERPLSAPAATVTSKADRNRWVFDRPSPTVVGTRRSEGGVLIGRQLAGDDRRDTGGHSGGVGLGPGQIPGVRVSGDEAATLQTFPADYPWQGTKSKQFQQVGNAIPPLLAKAVLSAATGIPFDQPQGA